MNITVGNANVTDTIASVLAIWQEDNDTQLRTHINTIVNIQDFLCRILTDASNEDARATIGQLLGEIVCVKDDLKQFINNTRYETK